MEKCLVSALLFTMITSHLMRLCLSFPCKSKGFGGCQCNFAGACDMNGNPFTTDPRLNGFAPSGLEVMAAASGLANRNLAYLCEGGVVAIMYDCNNRIPLYAATVMTGAQWNSGFAERGEFRKSNDENLDIEFQQTNNDYKDSSKREICYKTRVEEGRLVDIHWYRALNKHKGITPDTKCDQIIFNRKGPINKGHLIAARYGRGIKGRGLQTCTYTNVIPQFDVFNKVPWKNCEDRLEKWGPKHCNNHNNQVTTNVRMYIIVGIIPSSFPFSLSPRYFGWKGFSDDIDRSGYRVNVPTTMWTSACCTFQYQENGNTLEGIKHTAFIGYNIPDVEQKCVTRGDMKQFFQRRAQCHVRRSSGS